jgi:hypothetical protein
LVLHEGKKAHTTLSNVNQIKLRIQELTESIKGKDICCSNPSYNRHLIEIRSNSRQCSGNDSSMYHFRFDNCQKSSLDLTHLTQQERERSVTQERSRYGPLSPSSFF